MTCFFIHYTQTTATIFDMSFIYYTWNAANTFDPSSVYYIQKTANTFDLSSVHYTQNDTNTFHLCFLKCYLFFFLVFFYTKCYQHFWLVFVLHWKIIFSLLHIIKISFCFKVENFNSSRWTIEVIFLVDFYLCIPLIITQLALITSIYKVLLKYSNDFLPVHIWNY